MENAELIDLQIGPYLLKIYRRTDFDALLDALMEKGSEHEDFKDERIPYWADLWPSALGLCHFLAENPALLPPAAGVLELGCGLGLPGVLAGRMGGRVVLSDYEQAALEMAAANWTLNQHSKAETLLLDWRQPPAGLSPDLILASDVVYEKRLQQPLVNFLHAVMRPKTTFLLSEPNRPANQSFLKELPNQGFRVEKSVQIVRWNDRPFPVNIFRLNTKNSEKFKNE